MYPLPEPTSSTESPSLTPSSSSIIATMWGADIVCPVSPSGRGTSSYALSSVPGHTKSSLGTLSMASSTLLDLIIPWRFSDSTSDARAASTQRAPSPEPSV